MREIKSIVGLRVLSVEEGASVGIVKQVVVDLSTGHMLGLIASDDQIERGVLAENIQTIGSDVIMISSRNVAPVLSELPDLESRRQADNAPVGVFTATGRRLGVISSIFIDPYDKVVTRYEVSSGPLKDLADGVLILPILPGTVHGQDAVIVPEEQVRQLGREAGGWRGRFGQWSEGARKQVQQVSEQAEKLYESGSEVVKKEAAVVRERATKLSETGGETLREQAKVVREKAADVSAKAREAVSKLAEKEEAAPEEPAAEEEPAAITPVREQPDEIVPAPAHEPEKEQIVAQEPPVETGDEKATEQ